MRKVIAIGSCLFLTAAACFASSLFAGNGSRAGDRNNEPADVQMWENLKDYLLAEAEDILSTEEQNELNTNDAIFYDYYFNDSPYHTWDWLVVIFRTDDPDHVYTVKWESYTDNQDDLGTTIHIWNPADYEDGGERFVLKDTGPDGLPPWSSPRSFDIQGPRWFHYDTEEGTYKCWVLIEGITATGQRDMHTDVCRMDYTAKTGGTLGGETTVEPSSLGRIKAMLK